MRHRRLLVPALTALVPLLLSTQALAAALTVNGSASAITVPVGATVNLGVSGGPGNARDWVSLSTTAAADTAYISWKYLNGTTTPPASGVTSATVTFTMPTTAGTYNFRFFSDGSFNKLATSPTVTVIAAPTLTVNGSSTAISVAPGTLVGVAVAGGPGNATDWLGMYATTAPDTSYLVQKYLNGASTPPASGVTSATVQFTVPITPGSYNFRFFSSGSYNKLATSPTVTAPAIPGLTVTPAFASPGQTITVTVTGGPGDPRDWLGLYAWSAIDTGFTTWKYLNGTTTPPVTGLVSATVTFTLPATPGRYNIRLFASGGYTKLATTAPVVSGSFAAVSAGASHSLALRADGTVWAWGANDSGQLGDNSALAKAAPVQVLESATAFLSGVVAIAAGDSHSLAVKADGTVWGWGSSLVGQLGLGTSIFERRMATPITTVASHGTVTAIAGGAEHTLALRSDGKVLAWGRSTYGQVGDGTTTQYWLPVQLTTIDGAIAISAGYYHSLAVTSNGRVWAWGRNQFGQLGDNNTSTQRNAPNQVPGIADGRSVAAGSQHSLAIQSTGTLLTWGANESGQLGDGSQQPSPTPVVAGISAVAVVDAGYSHSMAVNASGQAFTWGQDYPYGQIGNGASSSVPQTTPYAVPNIGQIKAVGAGNFHSLALAADETLWAWGSGGQGQVGDGNTTIPHPSPVRISGPGLAWLVATPTFNPLGGPSSPVDSFAVAVSCATEGVTIHYTLDGDDPIEGDPTVASGGNVLVSQSLTLKARAWKGTGASDVAAATYALTVRTPGLNRPDGSVVIAGQTVTATSYTAGSTLRYTINAGTPTASDPEVPAEGIPINDNVTVRVNAWRNGWTTSQTTQATYSVQVPPPGLSPGDGSYGGPKLVTITAPGTIIHYTTSGLEPTTSNDTVASGGTVEVSGSLTLKAKAWKTGWVTSPTASAAYFITLGTVATPTLSPAGGTYSTAQSVSLASTTPGAFIRYSLDGTEPTLQSPQYAAPIVVDGTTTIKARAFKVDWIASPVATADYTLNLSAAATPRFVPAAGNYAVRQSVALLSSPGATVYYTLNGKDPTQSDPSVASGGTVLIDRSVRLKAKAWKSGVPESAVRTGEYRITGAVEAGGDTSFGLKADRTVWGWGAGGGGLLGPGASDKTTPVPIASQILTDIVQVSVGGNIPTTGGGGFALALTSDGRVYAWGYNWSGQLGIDGATTGSSSVPLLVPGFANVKIVAVSAAGHRNIIMGGHSLALTDQGTVYAWGDNSYGQLGDGTIVGTFTPKLVPGLTGVVQIAAGPGTSFALKTDGGATGRVWGWGANDQGQLGDGTPPTTLLESTPGPFQNNPRPVASLDGAVAVVAGGTGALAVKADRTVWKWGRDTKPLIEFQSANLVINTTAVPVPGLQAMAVAAGEGRSYAFGRAVRSEGIVAAWGNGWMGDGVATGGFNGLINLNVVNLPVLEDMVGVAAGGEHSLALKGDGSVWSWGNNNHGQLGLGTTLAHGYGKNAPLRVPAFSLTTTDLDPDGDGLSSPQEEALGTDPFNWDTNGDGMSDGAAVASGLSPTNLDMDSDGLSNAVERSKGTNPFRADTDGDGVNDASDLFPLDPTRWTTPPPNPSDTTPPVITLLEPPGAVPLNVPTLTVSATTVGLGAQIQVVVSDGPGNTRDWVALHSTSAPDTSYLSWKYLNGTTTAPTTGLTSATLTFTMPTTPGTYNLRFFANNTYTKLATSATVTVSSSTPTVTVSATTVSPGGAVQVTIANGPGNTRDWVALHTTSAPDTSYLSWKYLNGTTTAPTTGLTSAVLTFAMPATPGTYNFRFYLNNTYTKLATSLTVTVQ